MNREIRKSINIQEKTYKGIKTKPAYPCNDFFHKVDSWNILSWKRPPRTISPGEHPQESHLVPAWVAGLKVFGATTSFHYTLIIMLEERGTPKFRAW